MPGISLFPSGPQWPAATQGSAETPALSKVEQGSEKAPECRMPSLGEPVQKHRSPRSTLRASRRSAHACFPGLQHTPPQRCRMAQAEPSQAAGIYPSHQAPAAWSTGAGREGALSLTGRREISSRLSGASRNQSSCCCSSSALSGRGSLTRSGCTLRGERRSVRAGAAPERGAAGKRRERRCLWGISPVSPSIPAHEGGQSRRDCSTLMEPRQGIQSGQGIGCSHTPPRSPSQAARRRAAETSAATQLQLSKLLTYRAVQNVQRKRKRAPPGDCHPLAGAPGWVPTHCSASSRAPLPAGMGMREAKHSPPPAEGEQGGGIHLSLLHLSSRDLQEEPGDPPEAAATPLLGGWTGAATTPAPAAAPA